MRRGVTINQLHTKVGLVSAVSIGLFGITSTCLAESVEVTVHQVSAQGVGAPIGTITLADTPSGVAITPKLTGLPPGERGFHIHENPDCGP